VIWEYLKQFTRKNDWDKYLNFAAFSYNTSQHKGIKYTPYELVFGKLAPTSDITSRETDNESYSNYLTDLFHKIRKSQEIARDNLIKSKEKTKYYYDKKILKTNKIKEGDMVYLLRESQKNKLSDQYRGPYKVLELTNKNNVKIDLGNNKTRIVHMDKLKLSKHQPAR
jgi:hypothetical protein